MDALVAGGHGDHRRIAERMTWRQIELFFRAAEERRAETMAAAMIGRASG